MANKPVFERVKTNKPPEEMRRFVIDAFRPFGGIVQLTNNGFLLRDGKVGTSSFSFVVNLNANVIFKRLSESEYEIQVYLSWAASTAAILLSIFGFIFFMVILYFMYDPAPAYMMALQRAKQYLIDDYYSPPQEVF